MTPNNKKIRKKKNPRFNGILWRSKYNNVSLYEFNWSWTYLNSLEALQFYSVYLISIQQWNFYLKHSYGKIYIILLNISFVHHTFFFQKSTKNSTKIIEGIYCCHIQLHKQQIWFEKLNILVFHIKFPPSIWTLQKINFPYFYSIF